MTTLTSPCPAPGLLTVFFDGGCSLCSAEMRELKRLDRHGELELVDCAAAAFDDSRWRAEGVGRAQMLQALHVRDVLGDWHRGVDAIALLYATVGAPQLARLWAHPLTRPLARRIYPWVVRHRQALSALGLELVSTRVLRLMAWRQARRARCDHGACRMPDAWQ